MFSHPVHPPHVAMMCMGEFDPDKFAAVQLRIDSPRTTALVFASGKVVCTGAQSERCARLALDEFHCIIRDALYPGIQLLNEYIQNIVSKADLGRKLNVVNIYRKFQLEAMYQPELFPGMRLRLKNPKLAILMYIGGRMILTGAKTRRDIERGWQVALKIATPHMLQDDTELSHRDIARTRQVERAHHVGGLGEHE